MQEKDVQSPTHIPHARLSSRAADLWENELRGRLGLAPHESEPDNTRRKRGWIATAIIGLIAAITRFVSLSHPHQLIFDETYYVKDAYSLLTLGYEGAWADDVNPAFEAGDFSGLNTTDAGYVVHPPFGKWLLAIGQALFGADSSFGWRFSTAFFGVLAVVLLMRIALHMFDSVLLSSVAGLAMALDGMGIVMSRTGILDNLLAFFILAGFWAILKDREWWSGRLAHHAAHSPMDAHGVLYSHFGPRLFYRPWLIVAGVLLGAACGVKWSGIYAIAVFGILVFVWGAGARLLIKTPHWMGAGVLREGIPAFLQLVPTAIVTYVLCWTSWFASSHAWGRTWAENASRDELPVPFLPNVVNSFLHYHQQMWEFHHGLDSKHDYQSQPWMWIIQGRPVSFYWLGKEEAPDTCGSTDCVQAITSIGNIGVWWLGVLALIILVIFGLRKMDWRAEAIFAGYVATWFPWFLYTNRTIFQFYAIVMLPFVVLALAWALGKLTYSMKKPYAPSHSLSSVLAGQENVWHSISPGDEDVFTDFPAPQTTALDENDIENPSKDETSNTIEKSANTTSVDTVWFHAYASKVSKVAAFSVITLISVIALLWWPVWTGQTISYDFWHFHMFFTSWV